MLYQRLTLARSMFLGKRRRTQHSAPSHVTFVRSAVYVRIATAIPTSTTCAWRCLRKGTMNLSVR